MVLKTQGLLTRWHRVEFRKFTDSKGKQLELPVSICQDSFRKFNQKTMTSAFGTEPVRRYLLRIVLRTVKLNVGRDPATLAVKTDPGLPPPLVDENKLAPPLRPEDRPKTRDMLQREASGTSSIGTWMNPIYQMSLTEWLPMVLAATGVALVVGSKWLQARR